MTINEDVRVGQKVDGTLVVSNDGRKVSGKQGAFKHGRYAKIPATCNNCYYRGRDIGGNGKCPKYEKDALCAIRTDIKKWVDKFDTRNVEDCMELMAIISQELLERVQVAIVQSQWDGGLMDKATNAQINALVNIIKIMNEIGGRITVREVHEQSGEGRESIARLFREAMFEVSGFDNDNGSKKDILDNSKIILH